MEEQLINKIKGIRVDWDKEALWEELEPQLPRPKRKFPWPIVLVSLLLIALVFCGRDMMVSAEQAPSVVSGVDEEAAAVLVPSPTRIAKTAPSVNTITTAAPRTNDNQPAPARPTEKVLAAKAAGQQTTAATSLPLSTGEAKEASENKRKQGVTKLPQSTSPLSNKTHEEQLLSAFTSLEDQISEPSPKFSSQVSWQPADPVSGLPALLVAEVVSSTKQSAPSGVIRFSEGRKISQSPTSGLFIAVSAGVGSLQRTASTDAGEAAVNATLLENKAYEVPQFTVGADLGVGYQLANGFFFQSGLHYSVKQEQLNWQSIIKIDSLKYENERAYYSLTPLGDTTFYSGESDLLKISERQVKHWNTLTSYDLPLMVGYGKRRNKFNFQASLGVVLNLSQQFKGRVVNLNNELVENPAISASKKLGYLASLGVGYQVFGRHHLFIDGSYRRSPTYRMQEVEQRYSSYRVQVGVRTFLGR